MKLTNKLRKVFLILLLSLITMGIGSEAEAAEFWDLNQASVFIKQGRSDTCTLASAVMMVRRAAMASGNANWASITENSMRSTAWLEGSGLYYNFTYAGISVKHGTLAGRDHVISLLNQHPEGIVIYNTSKPHAILLTDYTEGIFFCADPANNTIAGRIPIASASITLDSASQYWYVDSPKITLGPANNTVTFDSEFVNGISYNSAKISTWASSTGTITEMGFYAGTNSSSLGKYATAKNVGWTRFHMEYEVANYIKLPAESTIYYQFFVVNGGKEYKTSLNSFITKAHKHEYTSTIKKPATCTEPGIRLYTCKDNDDSYEEKIPATGHQHTELRNVKSATCGQEGYTGDTYCKDCNTKLSSGKSIAKKTHTWDAGKITKGATCSAAGVKTYTCTVCKATKTESIPATGHQHTEFRNVKSATCGQEGYTGDTFCKDCNTKLSSGKSIAKKAHTWDAGKITQKATCIAKGVKTFTCTVCQATKTEEIPATGHGKAEVRNQKDATCKAEGYTGDSYCTVCNQKICAGKKIAKTAHSWDKGKITRQPTTAKTGIKTYTCTKCKTTRTETIAKLKVKKLAVGKIIKDKASNGVYKVLKGGLSVEFTKPITKKASVKIPDTIKAGGVTCKVTGISANAFKSNSSLKTISIGKNVITIGNNAFYGCKKLNKITGGNCIAKIGEKAFANCGSLSSVTIAGSVRSIGKQAFYNCKKLKSIVVNTVALTDKNIGAKAFSGTYVKPTVKVPAKQLKAYQKLLRSKGMSLKAKYVRFQISAFYKASGNYF